MNYNIFCNAIDFQRCCLRCVLNELLQGFVNVNGYDSDFQDKDTNKWAPCSPDTPGSVEMTWTEISPEDLMYPKATMVSRPQSYTAYCA